jgi:hypothetical protein
MTLAMSLRAPAVPSHQISCSPASTEFKHDWPMAALELSFARRT